MLDEYVAQSEAQGHLISENYYKALISAEKNNLSQLEKQREDMIAAFEEAMASGTIDEGSEAYYNMLASIDEVTQAIEASNTALLEYKQTIQQLSWEVFDILQERIAGVSDEANFLIELLGSKKLHDDKGQLTNEGLSTMGLHGQNYNVLMYQADKYAEEIVRLNKELEKDPCDQDLINRRNELLELQRESILAAEQEKDAIKSLVEEGIQVELDAIQELIDKRNEELNSVRDLYEYNKRVKEQTKEIASLEKQMAAYAGDDSEESRQKVQQLKVELDSAKEELQESEYDRYIDDQQKLLDELYLEYEEILNLRLDNIDVLLEQMITEINSGASIIGETINSATDSVGYTLSDSMKNIWSESSTSTNSVITTYGEKFTSAQTTTNAVLNSINTNLQSVIAQLNSTAKTNAKSASTSSVAKSSGNKKPVATKPNNNKSTGGDGKPKEGDKVKYVSGQYYYDSEGKKPLGSHNKGKYVYITNINKKGSHPYHISTGNKLGKGDLGWLKLSQISGYASGKEKILEDELAWTQEGRKPELIIRPSDGAILTPIAKGDSVLNATATGNIWSMANSPAEFIKNNLNLGSSGVPNNSSSSSSTVQNFENISFNLPNVKNYDELLSSLQKDPKFEKLIDAMTFTRMTGGSKLAKNKSVR